MFLHLFAAMKQYLGGRNFDVEEMAVVQWLKGQNSDSCG
jgi:hypothetical protein